MSIYMYVCMYGIVHLYICILLYITDIKTDALMHFQYIFKLGKHVCSFLHSFIFVANRYLLT